MDKDKKIDWTAPFPCCSMTFKEVEGLIFLIEHNTSWEDCCKVLGKDMPTLRECRLFLWHIGLRFTHGKTTKGKMEKLYEIYEIVKEESGGA